MTQSTITTGESLALRETQGQSVEVVSNSYKHASNWVEVSDALIQARIKQLQELGAPNASDPDFMGPQRAFIELVHEKIDARDPNFVDMFSEMELRALDNGAYNTPNYDLAHINQLDLFAGMVEEAQYRHDSGIDVLDPYGEMKGASLDS